MMEVAISGDDGCGMMMGVAISGGCGWFGMFDGNLLVYVSVKFWGSAVSQKVHELCS